MDFEWNDSKNQTNFKKHGIWFDEAQTVWADKHSIEFFDDQHSDQEDRFIRIGRSTRNKTLLVIFCERTSNTIRIISARQLTKNERAQYEEGI